MADLVELIRFPLAYRFLSVARVESPTPRLRRITFAGDELAGFQSLAPDDHVKVFFPQPGQPIPAVGASGLELPDGAAWPPARDYTPRRFDLEKGELTLDFVIHGEGPASAWAEAVSPGATLIVAGPRGSHRLTRTFDWYLFAGDETALPTIARFAEELPAGVRATAFIEVEDDDERQDVQSAATVQWRWLSRSRSPEPQDLLVEAVRTFKTPGSDGFAWVGGEAVTTRRLRDVLLSQLNLPRERVNAVGHWKRSVTNWDHHEPLD